MLKFFFLKWTLWLKKLESNFRLILALTFILSTLNIIYRFEWIDGDLVATLMLWNPSWLLFGPLLFCAYRSLTNKPIPLTWKQSLHLLPFLAFGAFYLCAFFTTDMANAWENPIFKYYQNSYGVIVLSTGLYSVYVLGRILLVNTKNKPDADALIITLSATYILIAVITTMMEKRGILTTGTSQHNKQAVTQNI